MWLDECLRFRLIENNVQNMFCFVKFFFNWNKINLLLKPLLQNLINEVQIFFFKLSYSTVNKLGLFINQNQVYYFLYFKHSSNHERNNKVWNLKELKVREGSRSSWTWSPLCRRSRWTFAAPSYWLSPHPCSCTYVTEHKS